MKKLIYSQEDLDLILSLENEKKDKEIERLKSRLEEYQEYVEINHKEIEKLKEDNEYLNKVNIELSTEKNRLNNTIEKLEQENAVLKTQVVNKDKYSYGIRMGRDKE